MGVIEHLREVYGPLLAEAPAGNDVSLRLDADFVARADASAILHVAMLRRHAIAAAFVPLFKSLLAKTASMKPPVLLRLRRDAPIYLVQVCAVFIFVTTT
jgi:hypothetical protein